jgi:hypothetical protein
MICHLTDRKGFTQEIETDLFYETLYVPSNAGHPFYMSEQFDWLPSKGAANRIPVVQFVFTHKEYNPEILYYKEAV